MQTEDSAKDQTAPLSTVVRVHALVTGRVQGVAYRAFTQHEARSRNLQGWVRNLPDGRVETEIQGPQVDVESLLTSLRQGPPLASVDDVQLNWVSVMSDAEGFQIVR